MTLTKARLASMITTLQTALEKLADLEKGEKGMILVPLSHVKDNLILARTALERAHKLKQKQKQEVTHEPSACRTCGRKMP